MEPLTIIITHEQANLFIRLLIAHFIVDFPLQTNAMVKNKRWFSWHMALHIGLIFSVTLLLTFSIQLSIVAALTHYLIDGLKISLTRKFTHQKNLLFYTDQALHVLSLLVIWAIYNNLGQPLLQSIHLPLTNYKFSLLLLGYTMVIWPVGYVLKFALKGIAKTTTDIDDSKLEHGGKLIGMFERIIILTFVLLNQYEAIGFLITGKSIIRFAQKEEGLRSEYVLVGTMMSYAISIILGVTLNYLLSFN